MSAYVPRHAPPRPRLTPVLLAALDAAVLAVAVAAVILAALALSRTAPAALSAPLPSSSAPAPVHAGRAPAVSQPRPRPRAAAPRPYVVQRNDSLWTIAAWYYGDGAAWPRIWAANRAVVGDNPDLLVPGERLTFPTAKALVGPGGGST